MVIHALKGGWLVLLGPVGNAQHPKVNPSTFANPLALVGTCGYDRRKNLHQNSETWPVENTPQDGDDAGDDNANVASYNRFRHGIRGQRHGGHVWDSGLVVMSGTAPWRTCWGQRPGKHVGDSALADMSKTAGGTTWPNHENGLPSTKSPPLWDSSPRPPAC